MKKTRLEAFSDGVYAIIITIMVLEIRPPDGVSLRDLAPLAPVLIAYILSFVFIGIYWGNHHHLIYTVTHISSKHIWANMHLLFWLTLIPFSTSWLGHHPLEKVPAALYSLNLLFCSIAYFILEEIVKKHYHEDTQLILALRKHRMKALFSVVLYVLCVGLAFVHPLVSEILLVLIAIMWVLPDKNIERAMKEDRDKQGSE